jgi:hypothetical protein
MEKSLSHRWEDERGKGKGKREKGKGERGKGKGEREKGKGKREKGKGKGKRGDGGWGMKFCPLLSSFRSPLLVLGKVGRGRGERGGWEEVLGSRF